MGGLKTFAPDYYNNFKCIADKCRHSCCKGWEIYIDDSTLERYEGLGSKFTDKLQYTEDGVCFCLTEDEKCPFLNKNGLCDIISEMGDGYISDICREHPRFYNWFSHRTEVGLGLSCEEAARIILSQRDKTELVVIDDDGEECDPTETEEHILAVRDKLLTLAQDRSADTETRIEKILSCTNGEIPDKSIVQWAEILSKLEIMDSNWCELLRNVKSTDKVEYARCHEVCFEKLLVYFIYRHVTASYDTVSLAKHTAFACLGTIMIKKLWLSSEEQAFDNLCNIAMMYSAEIEYSEDNTAKLIEMMERSTTSNNAGRNG